jgi:vancomycin resistance protein VanW
MLEHALMASQEAVSMEHFGCVMASRASRMRREGVDVGSEMQRGKETNVRRGVQLLHSTVVHPGQVFSYHHLVGRPSSRRGFVAGPELHNQALSKGVGGGCCQITNMLYQLGLLAGLDVVERHRHSLDLYPDHGRSVPFGCGATVFYNRADLRLRNPWPYSILLDLTIEDGMLRGAFRSPKPMGFWVDVYEQDHHFFHEHGQWFRENELWRSFYDAQDTLLESHRVAHNLATTLYTPDLGQPHPDVRLRSDHLQDSV